MTLLLLGNVVGPQASNADSDATAPVNRAPRRQNHLSFDEGVKDKDYHIGGKKGHISTNCPEKKIREEI